MSCTKHFLGLEWTHHHWQPRVAAAEIMSAEEADMWGKPVYRDYVRCDKQQVCTECGAIRHERSCVCEPGTAEHCTVYLAWKAESDQAAK